MNKYLLLFATVLFFTACNPSGEPEQKQASPFEYPTTAKEEVVDTYFGTEVPDPYRWLEDDHAPETKAWVQAQNKVTFDYLEKIPQRDKINERLTELWNYPKYSTPFEKAGYYLFYKNDGVQDQSVLYYQESLEDEPKVLLDPNTFSEDGTVALSGISISKDGKYLAYGTSKGGSDWKEVFIMEMETKELLTDHIQWVKFSGTSWQGNGFYYSRYDAPEEGSEYSGKNEFHKVYYHEIGTSQSEDRLIHEDKNHPQRNFYVGTTDDESYLLMYASKSTSGHSLHFKKAGANTFTAVDTTFEYEYSVIDNIGDELLVLTTHNAPNQRVVMINTNDPAPENWREIIPEKEHVLESIALSNGKIVARYLEDVKSKLYVFDLEGNQEREIELPGLGLASFSGSRESPVAFYSFTTFTTPTTIYQYNMDSNTSEVFYQPKMGFNSEDFVTEQIFYSSKDGTEIPMFITYKKGLKKDGSNPTFLYGYGGFNISIKPNFKVDRLPFLENGGIYAVANMRGGGEYGEQWHEAGTQLQKQNVFDDFIAAAEYLINEKYTKSEKLAVHGRSNGGLLIGAVMTQRPDLFKVALPKVGVLDMLRYHKFTIGWAWADDYGTSEEEEHFKNLIAYSPLHNLKETAYPATLVMTADHDDRVVPAHSFKFAATLQEKHRGDNPVLIRIDTDAGHGAGKPVSKQIEEFADTWSFVFYNLGMEL